MNLLWSNDCWMMRTDVISSLKSTFISMSTPPARFKLFLSAKEKGVFFVAKGPYCHTVGLTTRDAFGALTNVTRKMQFINATRKMQLANGQPPTTDTNDIAHV
mmetsp:Transcript_28165/g.42128  ORF Transcript_28165/g.42128 Transcript_28165/m.42128 type:complete len:103 (+) Transcript_28165:256-564(+)